MLETVFLQVLNMSVTGGMVILFVLIARLLLKKAPKIFSYALWSVVLFRLCCPFSFESAMSLLPYKTGITPAGVLYTQTPGVDVGIPAVSAAINAALPVPNLGDSVNPMQIVVAVAAAIWLVGIAVLLIYSVVSLLNLRRRLRDAVHESGNIYTSPSLTSPFVMGLFSPKIYLPASLTARERDYILLHEQTHIKRLDHAVKLFCFFVLCVHWFNPLVWVAFFLCGRDMELSCDEAVIKKLGSDVKKDYSTSLLTLATGRRIVGGTPLAFGEGDTKSRIKNVLNYKKPAFWV
ncbi:MAG: M56 family metallopeptidase, partial [Oscillospiraceae bacterium]